MKKTSLVSAGKIRVFLKKTWESLANSTVESKVFFVPFGYLLIIGYLIFYIFNLLVASPTGYENLAMRIIVAVLGVGLILKDYWPNSIKFILPAYWYITLIYSLPFFFGFMLLHNPQSNIWQINGLVGAVTLTFFVGWRGYLALTFIGASIAYISFCIMTQGAAVSSALFPVFGCYSAPIVYLILFSHRRKQLFKDTLLAEEKEFSTQLLQKSEELKKALSIKNEFLNNISHEVRTPISGVVNISELLVDNWNQLSEKERFENMQVIAKSGSRLFMLMNDILDLSKFESGKMNMEISAANLEDLIHDIVEECQVLYLQQNKNITLTKHITPNLKSHVAIDPIRITQVLRNLLGNAIKFTPVGEIQIYLQKQGDSLEVIVKDEGVGIPESELGEIFLPFMQSSRTKNQAGGTGLGLAMCKEILEFHNGKIWGENNPKKGASFHFLLPSSSAVVQNEGNNMNTNNKVLVIDDEQISHNILHLILKSKGLHMKSVYCGEEGLSYLREHRDINIIFLDLMLPDMHGLDVLQIIKSDKLLQDIPVIIHSGIDDSRVKNKAILLGAVSFLSKPYDKQRVFFLIDKYNTTVSDVI